MLRIKIPQGIVTALADARAGRRRGAILARLLPRHDAAEHPVPLRAARRRRRGDARAGDEGLTTREACGNSVRNITGCPYAGTSESEIFDVTPYAEAMTRYFLRHPLAGVLPRKFKIAFEGCAEDHALASIHDIGWRARIVDGQRGFRVTVAGGTSILPVSGYVLYDFLPVERDVQRGGGGGPRLPPLRRLQASAAEPDEVRRQGAWAGTGTARASRNASTSSRRKVARGCAFDPDAVAIGDSARLDSCARRPRFRPLRPRRARPSTARASCRARFACSRCPTRSSAGCAATSASSGSPATTT